MPLIDKLQTEFGDALTIREATNLDSVDGVQPQAVVGPHDAEAVQKVVAWCGREKVAFIPRGGGTKMSRGARPEHCDLIISTEHLTQVIDHDEGNATVTVQAGITLQDLDKAMRQRHQFVPMEGADRDGEWATIGGIVATNYSGATKLKYGAPRDLVTGLHAALSDGRYIKAGSKVVKNVSGYDLNRIFIGSLGTLGLITQVTLRLRPEIAETRTWWGEYKSLEEAAEASQFILDGAFEPTALRVIVHDSRWHLMAHFEGGQAAVAAQLSRLAPSMSAPAGDSRAAQILLRAVLPIKRAPDWVRAARGAEAMRVCWDCGLGIARAGFDDVTPETVNTLRSNAVESGGFLFVDEAPPELKTPALVWGEPRGDFALMRKLKEAFDPARVCSPGRFVGGL